MHGMHIPQVSFLLCKANMTSVTQIYHSHFDKKMYKSTPSVIISVYYYALPDPSMNKRL